MGVEINSLKDFAYFVKDVFLLSKNKATVKTEWKIQRSSKVNINTNDFLDVRIVNDIHKNMTMLHSKFIKYGGIDISFEFWNDKLNLDKACLFLQHTLFLVDVLNRFYKSNKKTSPILKLVLINYKGKKQIPRDNKFTSFDVNSGATNLYLTTPKGLCGKVLKHGKVIVYRHEEMAKVLTHELIHFYKIYNIDQLGSDLNARFCLKREVSMNEAITECLACILNICIYTVLQGGEDFLNRLYTNQQRELKFMTGQAYKVLKINDFYESCSKQTQIQTNTTAYFVIKALLLQNMDTFIKYHNELITVKYISKIEELLKSFDLKTFGKKEYEQQKDKKTLRMTILDIVDVIPCGA
jgi:hypothetical protein